jgi:hypothetical protein
VSSIFALHLNRRHFDDVSVPFSVQKMLLRYEKYLKGLVTAVPSGFIFELQTLYIDGEINKKVRLKYTESPSL